MMEQSLIPQTPVLPLTAQRTVNRALTIMQQGKYNQKRAAELLGLTYHQNHLASNTAAGFTSVSDAAGKRVAATQFATREL